MFRKNSSYCVIDMVFSLLAGSSVVRHWRNDESNNNQKKNE